MHIHRQDTASAINWSKKPELILSKLDFFRNITFLEEDYKNVTAQ